MIVLIEVCVIFYLQKKAMPDNLVILFQGGEGIGSSFMPQSQVFTDVMWSTGFKTLIIDLCLRTSLLPGKTCHSNFNNYKVIDLFKFLSLLMPIYNLKICMSCFSCLSFTPAFQWVTD